MNQYEDDEDPFLAQMSDRGAKRDRALAFGCLVPAGLIFLLVLLVIAAANINPN